MSRPQSRPGQPDLWLLRQPWTEPPGAPLRITELDEGELRRADSFHRAHDRLLYLTAHIALRRLLASYLGIAPQEVRFTRQSCPACGAPHGRPAVAGGALHYSLSHTSGLALFGVAAEPVGVDVEVVPSEETVDLCVPALHPAERAELAEPSGSRRRASFARLWTRKEAYLKAIGTGLCRDLAADYLGETSDGTVPSRPPGWVVRNVDCGSRHVNHVAAAAVGDRTTWSSTVRWLPADCLYSRYAADLIGADPRTELGSR